jgi:hypothetical protein
VKVTQVENGEFLRNLAQLIQPHTADIEDEFTDFLLSPQAVKQDKYRDSGYARMTA